MLIDTKINNFKLPYIVQYDKDYYIELSEYLNRYLNHLNQIPNLDQECLDSTKSNINLINESLKLYNNANIGEAKECIKKMLAKYCNSPYIVATLDKNYAFRGIAPDDIPKKYNYDKVYADIYRKMNNHPLSFYKARVAVEAIKRIDMLHIPFDKRGLITTQRFSIAGVPCLYVATTALGCWLEMEIPEFDVFQVSSYKLPNDLKVLNLCISQYIINSPGYLEEDELYDFHNFIEIFPLVCATSFKVQELNRKFKSEYIVSQLLMQVTTELGIDGIAYLSKKMDDYYAYPQAVNLAIPITCDRFPPYNEKLLEMYWKDANKIKLTDAYRFSEFLKRYPEDNDKPKPPYSSYANEIYHDSHHNKVLLYGKVIEYTETRFSEFDEFLLNQKHCDFK